MAPNHSFRKSLPPRPCDSVNNIVSGFNNFVKEYLRGKDSAGGSGGKEPAWNTGDMGSIPGGVEIPWRRELLPTLVFLPGEFPRTEEPGGLQSMGAVNESDTTYNYEQQQILGAARLGQASQTLTFLSPARCLGNFY